MEKQARILFDISQKAFKTGSPWTKQQFIEQLNNPKVMCLTINKEDRVAGFALWQVVLDEAELLLIAVTPSCQGTGIGKQLMNQSFEALKQQNIISLFLEVRQSNESGMLFYQTLDFKVIGMRKNYYHYPTEDAILMSLDI